MDKKEYESKLKELQDNIAILKMCDKTNKKIVETFEIIDKDGGLNNGNK